MPLPSGPEIAERYQELCRQQGEACPRCGAEQYYPLKDGRRRCAGCRYTFHLLSGRFIHRCRISLKHWHLLVRSFVNGVTAQDAAENLGLAYDTVQKAFHTLRLAILHHMVPSPDLFTPSGELVPFCPNLKNEESQAIGSGCLSYVFALNATGGSVKVRLVRELKAREVMAAPVNKKRWRNFIHTGSVNGHGALVFSCCKRGRQIYQHSFTDADTWLDHAGGFKAFADGWFARYRAFKPEAYPLYLAEAVLRHGLAAKGLIRTLDTYLCAPVPKHREKKMP